MPCLTLGKHYIVALISTFQLPLAFMKTKMFNSFTVMIIHALVPLAKSVKDLNQTLYDIKTIKYLQKFQDLYYKIMKTKNIVTDIS